MVLGFIWGQYFCGVGATGDLWLLRRHHALGIWSLLAGCREDPKGTEVLLSAQALCPGLLHVWTPWLCQMPGRQSSNWL